MITGSSIRAAKKAFEPSAFTRRAADILISNSTDIDLIRSFAEKHANKNTKRHAAHRANRLEQMLLSPEVIEPEEVVVQETLTAKSEFDLLVERFTAEGKPNPVKSARASIAAKAQSAKRAAAKLAS